jgi:3-dehydroquinate synthetase
MGKASAIYLYGPPASGKTTLGARLARALRRDFIDLDAEIERRTGRHIPDIFRDDGEAAFRAIEAATLRDVAAGQGSSAVVALGGGTLLDPANRALAESTGRVWRLEPPSPEELARRIALRPGSRPLGDKSRERAVHYASFPRAIAATFDLDDSLVVIGSGLGALCGFAKMAVADATASSLHPSALADIPTFNIPSGEDKKRIETVCSIWNACHGNAVTRRDRILAFGGGGTGDMTGFAAATWMRGIDWINVPTTLLSMVDASTGGKTGFDLQEGKNLVGAFHPPALVLIDTDYLSTLPPRELASGQAEMIKHEIISGMLRPSVAGIPTAGEIAANLAVKVDVVRQDPHETKGMRMLLNCGHTIGHAIEAASGYALSHGEAVAIGCVEEARIAVRLGLASADWPEMLAARFSAASLPVAAPQFDRATVAAFMAADKKRDGDGIVFALPCGWGDVRRVTLRLGEIA